MTFTTPITDRYFEDYVPGDVHEFGSIVVEETEMIDFARRFDPQPFHTDPEAAKESPYGAAYRQRLAHCEYGYAASG
jgi:acyl dehydratase